MPLSALSQKALKKSGPVVPLATLAEQALKENGPVAQPLILITDSEDEVEPVSALTQRAQPSPIRKAKSRTTVLKDERRFPDFVRGMVDAFPGQLREKLASALAKLGRLSLAKADTMITMTTACSGTELAVYVMEVLFIGLAADGLTEEKYTPISLWSCDKDSLCQRWMTEIMGSEKIFLDVNSLGESEAEALDADGQRRQLPVDAGAVHIAGFSCRDVSHLGINRDSHRNCILEGAGSTGGTFYGEAKFVFHHRPPVIMFENVKGLAGDNLLAVRLVLWLMGYRLVVLQLNAYMFHVPQSRPRLYIFAVLSTERGKFALQDADDADSQRLQGEAEALAMMMQQEEASLDMYLHQIHLPLMVMHSLERKSQVPRDNFRDKWQKTHEVAWRKAGYAKVPAMHPIAARLVGEWPMPEREAQVVSYICYVHQPEPDTVVVLDASQNITRVPRQVDRAPCVTPGAKMIMLAGNDFTNVEDEVLQSRPLLGPELLHLQGLNVFDLATSDRCHRFSHTDMAKLAGNAFCGCQLGVAFLVGLTVLGEFLPDTESDYNALLDHKDLFLDGDVDDIFDEVDKFITHKRKADAPRARASRSAKEVALACRLCRVC